MRAVVRARRTGQAYSCGRLHGLPRVESWVHLTSRTDLSRGWSLSNRTRVFNFKRRGIFPQNANCALIEGRPARPTPEMMMIKGKLKEYDAMIRVS
jgi:hypothetical protein